MKYLKHLPLLFDLAIGISLFVMAMRGNFFSAGILLLFYAAARILIISRIDFEGENKDLKIEFKGPTKNKALEFKQLAKELENKPRANSEPKPKSIWDDFFPKKERQAEVLEQQAKQLNHISDDFYERQIKSFKGKQP